ncbi:MAG: hypothetical protein NVS9B4_00230 [Candidatus Acidiferrum sp.]
MPANEQAQPDYNAELARCTREIENATQSLKTGISVDTGKPVSLHEAMTWRNDWIEERKLIRKEEQAKAMGIST